MQFRTENRVTLFLELLVWYAIPDGKPCHTFPGIAGLVRNSGRKTVSHFSWNCASELRQGFEQVGDEAVVGDLEDRGVLVLVDGDDDLRVLHAGEMLDGAGNAAGDVELRRHHLAGLADLPVV